MRWSRTFIPTLKETPAEAEILSHRLLLRAGLVRKLAGGLYTYLPLALRILQRIEAIVREEMNRTGALELLMPALQPPEIWKRSGRYRTASRVLFHATDHMKREWVLGPTHEEVVTSLVADEIHSYRRLPVNFYQIQTKFRDEIRPRFGLMRAREFVMKDAYSFDVSPEAARRSYRAMFDAYVRIFRRCGLDAVPVQADSGVMGGRESHEYMAPAETGENEILFSSAYAANREKARSALAPPFRDRDAGEQGPPEPFDTPGCRTIEDLAGPPWGIPATSQIKTLVYRVEDRPVLILLSGSDALNEAKLAGVLGTAEFRPARPEEIRSLLGADPGSLGAVGVREADILADHMLEGGFGLVTGANRNDVHLRSVCIERDIPVTRWADLRTVRPGEPCPETGEPLQRKSAIELGHVFLLGTGYSESLGALFLDDRGVQRPAVMGCYGIGITRTLQAIIEQNHDEHGILWPVSVAPFTVCLTVLDIDPRGRAMREATALHDALEREGVEVILDDRDERPGVKFKDSELVGFPLRIAFGPRALSRDAVEWKPRGGTLEEIPIARARGRTLDWLSERRD